MDRVPKNIVQLLAWVSKDACKLLQEAERIISEGVDGEGAIPTSAITLVHQVKNVLTMVEHQPSALYIQGVEDCIAALGDAPSDEDAEDIAQMLRDLQTYLEIICQVSYDNPKMLRDGFKKILRRRDSVFIVSDGPVTFYIPEFSPCTNADQLNRLAEMAGKMRGVFQKYTINSIKESFKESPILGKMIDALSETIPDDGRKTLWAGVKAFLAEPAVYSEDSGTPISGMMKLVDKQLKQYAASGDAGAIADLSQDEISEIISLLYCTGRTQEDAVAVFDYFKPVYLASTAESQEEEGEKQYDRNGHYHSEIRGHIETLREWAAACAKGKPDSAYTNRAQIAAHSIKGTSRAVENHVVSEWAALIEEALRKFKHFDIEVDKAITASLAAASTMMRSFMLSKKTTFFEIPAESVRALEDVVSSIGSNTVDGVMIPHAIAVDALNEYISDNVDAVFGSPFSTSEISDTTEESIGVFCGVMRGLAQKAEAARMTSVSTTANAVASASEVAMQSTNGLQELGHDINHALAAMQEYVDAYMSDRPTEVDAGIASALLEKVLAFQKGSSSVGGEKQNSYLDSFMDVLVEDAKNEDIIDLELNENYQEELLAFFLEEAMELEELLDAQMVEITVEAMTEPVCSEIKRILHTLKGGARMSGIMGVGEIAHNLETAVEDFEAERNPSVLGTVSKIYRQLGTALSFVKRMGKGETWYEIKKDVYGISDGDAGHGQEEAFDSNVISFPFKGMVFRNEAAEKVAASSNKESVRLSGDQIEDLLGLSSETSLNRTRIEQSMSDFRALSDEMDLTIRRAQDQLRRLSIETDAQIQSRTTEMQSHKEGFDPLEMDRYSNLQQLTRSMQESIVDLGEIKSLWASKIRDADALLVQQSRLDTGVQERLMRTKMVPFSRVESRFTRLIRQVSSELKKDITLDFDSSNSVLDRNMLDRMTSPMEHMLRNACDHGIEAPHVRMSRGKLPGGRIKIWLERLGADVILHIKDDGAGVNIDAVRKKAIERGLMTEDQKLSDSEIAQFIMHAGFSTAEKVTQISGRGVGMDVVCSEIKELGGSISIKSEQGKGTEFIVHLPFTVSVNSALMFGSFDEVYAVPLNAIEGVVRLHQVEIDEIKNTTSKCLSRGGIQYELHHIADLTGHPNRKNTIRHEGLTPVVLMRCGDRCVAIQVDRLLGSRDIVIKSIGGHFSNVSGVSGATLLGNGGVVLILDVAAALGRLDAGVDLGDSSDADEDVVEVKAKTVMVCDDSVTVRKVTSRFLSGLVIRLCLQKTAAMHCFKWRPDYRISCC